MAEVDKKPLLIQSVVKPEKQIEINEWYQKFTAYWYYAIQD